MMLGLRSQTERYFALFIPCTYKLLFVFVLVNSGAFYLDWLQCFKINTTDMFLEDKWMSMDDHLVVTSTQWCKHCRYLLEDVDLCRVQ